MAFYRCCFSRSEEHTSELQSPCNLVFRLLLAKKEKQGGSPGAAVLDRRRALSFREGLWHRRAVVVPGHLRAGGSLLIQDSYFFFNDPATTEIYTLSLHDALPI